MNTDTLLNILKANILIVFILVSGPATAGTLEDVRSRGHLICGVNEGLPGFSEPGPDAKWRGFDVDFCRALSVAIFGLVDKVTFVPLSTEERFNVLKAGKVDVLSRNSTWTMSRDIGLELEFAGVIFYDGQGFLVRKSQGLSSALELTAARICLLSGTTTETNVKTYFANQKMKNEITTFSNRPDLLKAYDAGECDAYASDRSALAADRLNLKNPDEQMILPEVISKEPLGPVVRQNDPRWIDLVRWTLFTLVNAEEIGWYSDPEMTNGAVNGDAKKLMTDAGIAIADDMGLSEDWIANVVEKVGNYSELFERNVGAKTPLGLARGINALWTRGGILYAPPMR